MQLHSSHIIRSLKMCHGCFFFGGIFISWTTKQLPFFLFDRENHLTLTASFIGAVSLIFCIKGNPFGQFLMVVFSVFYGIISFSFSYYGEMITYLGMTAPMAVFSLFSWLHNPYFSCDFCFLFYIRRCAHRQSTSQYHLCWHQLSGSIFNFFQKSFLCRCLCSQWSCADPSMGFGSA